ncbi:hypothetical protein T439DRAFT_375809 [Meredithblackwellia eburnea MCA 4105]
MSTRMGAGAGGILGNNGVGVTGTLPEASTSRLSLSSEQTVQHTQLQLQQQLLAMGLMSPPLNHPPVANGSPALRSSVNGNQDKEKQREIGRFGISTVLLDPTAPSSLLPAFPSLASNPYVPSSLSSLSTAFSSGAMPKASPGGSSTKPVAQRRSRAPPVVVSEVRKVEKEREVDPYLKEVGTELERWERERRLGSEGRADLGGDEGLGLGIGEDEVRGGGGGAGRRGSRQQEEELPPLDQVPQIFFDQSFNLANPRTFDLVTERIQLTPSPSPALQDLDASPVSPTTPRASQSPPTLGVTEEPGVGPVTLADLATDQILQEKLSHYTAVIESHLVREIGLRSSSFFSALSNLQNLHQQGEDCLVKIGELQSALGKEEDGVGVAAKRGLEVLRTQARRRGLERIEQGMREVQEVWEGLEGVRELVESGEWMGALEVAEQVEGTYYGVDIEGDGESPRQEGHMADEDEDGVTIVLVNSPPIDSPTTPKLPSSPSARKRPGSTRINLTRIKALDSIPSKLASYRSQVARSLEGELVGVLDHEMEVAVEEYVRMASSDGWGGRKQLEEIGKMAALSPGRVVASPLEIGHPDKGGGESVEETGREKARERAKDRARPVVGGLVRADGMEGAVASWRESVLKVVRAMVREYLPTSDVTTAEDEDAFANTSSRASVDLGSVSEKSVSLAKKLRSLSPEAFLSLAAQTYTGLLGTIEVIDIHSKVILELANDFRETERIRKARRRGITLDGEGDSLSPTNGSMLSVPGAPEKPSRPSLTLSTSSLDTTEDSTLSSDVADVLHAAAELANLRFSKVIGVRTEVHANLPLEDFVEIFDASWAFVVQCEVLCQRMIVGLRGVMVSQAKTFLQTFHQKRITDAARLVENEQWSASDVPPSTQKVVALIVQSAMSDPIELLIGKRREARLQGSGVDNVLEPSTNGDAQPTKQLDIEGREYFAVSAGLASVDVLIDYLKVVMNCPLLTTDTMSKIVEYMKAFNSRTCQVVLGAGAMRSAGLKNITAKHLALASQALSIMIALIPYIRETLRRHFNPKQAVMLIEFDKLKRDFQEHQNEIHAKLVAIMSDRLHIHCKTLEGVNWEQAPPGRKEGAPSSYMEALVKEHLTLHKVLSRFLQSQTVDFIMGQVFSALNSRLAEEFGKIDVKTEAAKARLMVDATYLKTKLAELKGLERETPGSELENLIESKITPEAAAQAPHTRKPSLNGGVPAAALSSPTIPSSPSVTALPPSPPPVEPITPIPASTPSTPPPVPTIVTPAPPSSQPTPPLPSPSPTTTPLPPPNPPVRKKSMAERLAEATRRKRPIEKPDLPAVPQEPEVQEVNLVPTSVATGEPTPTTPAVATDPAGAAEIAAVNPSSEADIDSIQSSIKTGGLGADMTEDIPPATPEKEAPPPLVHPATNSTISAEAKVEESIPLPAPERVQDELLEASKSSDNINAMADEKQTQASETEVSEVRQSDESEKDVSPKDTGDKEEEENMASRLEEAVEENVELGEEPSVDEVEEEEASFFEEPYHISTTLTTSKLRKFFLRLPPSSSRLLVAIGIRPLTQIEHGSSVIPNNNLATVSRPRSSSSSQVVVDPFATLALPALLTASTSASPSVTPATRPREREDPQPQTHNPRALVPTGVVVVDDPSAAQLPASSPNLIPSSSSPSPPRKKARFSYLPSSPSLSTHDQNQPLYSYGASLTNLPPLNMAQSIDVEPSSDAGIAVPASNGHGNGHTNGAVLPDNTENRIDAMDYDGERGFKPLWPGSELDRREFVRITLQALRDIGYDSTAKALSAESGFTLETTTVTELRDGILHGKWSNVERLLKDLPPESVTDMTTVKFLVLQQKFLEALEAKDTKKALIILRNELAPLHHDSGRLHMLSSWLMCNSPEDLRVRANWDGVDGKSREQLLANLQLYISPNTMLPQRRLSTLLEQAKSYQRSACIFHAVDTPISLLADCKCDPNLIPSVTTHILTEHKDEIWRLEFSHDGEWLATAGRDKTAILWRVKDDFELDKILAEHNDPIAALAWSPDDKYLLTAAESVIKMWDAETGVCIHTLTQHTYPVGAFAWYPDGSGFVSGGMDSRICSWDLAGNMSNLLPPKTSPTRVIDLAITPDAKRLVIVGRADIVKDASRAGSAANSRAQTPAPTPPIIRNEKKIIVVDLATKTVEYEINQPGELTSVAISSDSRFAIVSHAPNEILYIDLRDGTIIRRFLGHDQGQFVLQSCFGGALQNYVLSGSEDGKVYLWHRDTGSLINVLEGHGGGTVNSVAWNNSHPGMFASASDDMTVRVWGMPDIARRKPLMR